MVRKGVDMINDDAKQPRRGDRTAHRARRARPRGLPAIGIEAEFATIVDDVQVRPDDVLPDGGALRWAMGLPSWVGARGGRASGHRV